jgi:ADP-heptose:LPS heptosyltransferase
MNSYLIFRTDRVGDFLISAILIKSIKNSDSKANITVVASKKNYSYIREFNYVDEVLLLEKSFISKIRLICTLAKKKFTNIIVHDDKNRSKFISFFLRAKNKIFVQNNDASHIEIIKNILKRIGYEFNETSLNTIDEKNLNISKNSSYVLLHFDEKWIHADYIKKFTKIEPTKNELSNFINLIINKTGINLVITTGLNTPMLLSEIMPISNNNQIKFYNELDFVALAKIVTGSEILISCHGAISHVAAAKNIKQIDIIDNSYNYAKWTEHFRNYNYLYREKFNILSKQIINKLVNFNNF